MRINSRKGEPGKKFPEVRFIDITESPEDPDSLLINVTAPKDEDRRQF
jgi:hypothetical protein